MIKKHIPNSITCCNLISGCIATYFAFRHDFEWALAWMVIGAVFDFFDGMTARLLHVSSPIGKELDSLADDITFGLAPSAMLFAELGVVAYPSALERLREVLPFVAFVMAAFSALRLAKFNLDERQSLGFIGLPTPANALFWGSLMVGVAPHFESSPLWAVAMVVGVLVSSYLLVSEIPMFALKFKQWGWKGNEVKYLFVLSCIPILALLRISGIAVIIAWYVLLSAMVAKKPAPQNH